MNFENQKNTGKALETILQAAIEAHGQGQIETALRHYATILKQDKHHIGALTNLASLHARHGDSEKALEYYRQALECENCTPEVWFNHGNLQKKLGNRNEAVDSFKQALRLNPNMMPAHYNLATILRDQGQMDEAIEHYRTVVKLDPKMANGWLHLGDIYRQRGDLELAEQCYRETSTTPVDSYCSLAHRYQVTNRWDEAERLFLLCLDIEPDHSWACASLATLYRLQTRFEEAVSFYRRAIASKPDYIEAKNDLGMVLLYLEQFEEGFQYYETRYEDLVERGKKNLPPCPFPQWQGQSLQGKSLLVVREQGLGDQIQFSRYLPLLKEMGVTRLSLICSAALKKIFAPIPGIDEVIVYEGIKAIPRCDYWTYLLSVPLHVKTRIDTIPADIPYLYAKLDYLKVMQPITDRIKEYKVGVCWKGSTNLTTDEARSPGIEVFKHLFNVPGVRFFTLLPDSRKEFLAATREEGRVGVDLGFELDEFDQTAALMMGLDLIITCDTASAHLAGALGRPVWIAIPFDPDWRWMINRDDTPWYPHTRLFRQTERGNWNEVFERMAVELQKLV